MKVSFFALPVASLPGTGVFFFSNVLTTIRVLNCNACHRLLVDYVNNTGRTGYLNNVLNDFTIGNTMPCFNINFPNK